MAWSSASMMAAIASGERPTIRGAKWSRTTVTRLGRVSALPCRRQACVSPMPATPASVWSRTIRTSTTLRAAPCEILVGCRSGTRNGMVSTRVILTPAMGLRSTSGFKSVMLHPEWTMESL
jgi:hypothetical protein